MPIINAQKIVIFKSRKILQFWDIDINQTIIQYPIGIGRNPIGTKRVEGDGKTPEGEYQICVKNPNSKFYLSAGLNYPNIKDAEFGLQSNQISRSEYDLIVAAHLEGGIPPWKTALGGEIFIHGELEIRSESEGCIRMYNEHIKELFAKILIGTRVFIFA
jgi:murein L,D-transpeptidase YafK